MSLLDGRDLGEMRVGLEADRTSPIDLTTVGRSLPPIIIMTRPTPNATRTPAGGLRLAVTGPPSMPYQGRHGRPERDALAISPTYWDFGDEREDPIHRIHSYPAKFPAFITTKALRYAQRNGVNVDLVADVFCGCGTTAVEALRNGKSFWGCDINPVATLIAHVKTRFYDDSGIERQFDAIKRHVHDAKPVLEDGVPIAERIHYWFDDGTINDLVRLHHAIDASTPPKSRYRKFFLCAFSNILKPTSRWLTKSIKPQLDPDKSPRAVSDAFADQVTLMRKANSERVSTLTSMASELARISHTVTAEGRSGSVGAEFLPREQVEQEQAALRPCFREARVAGTAA